MSSEYIALLFYIRSQFATYVSIPICILCSISELFSIIVFLSLKTFRQSSCAFYLMIMSVFNFIRLVFGTSLIIISTAFPINWTPVLLYYCQLRTSIIGLCYLGAITTLCLAVIDQYFATSARPQWQRWSNIKFAHRLVLIITIIWAFHASLFFIYFNQLALSNTATCIATNQIFVQYYIYGYFFTYGNFFPLVSAIFAVLAFRNARSLATRTNPVVRRELDKQLTVMVLVEVCVYICTYLPFAISNGFSSLNTNRDPILLAQLNLINAVTLAIFTISNGNSFFTYICVSKRFRRQAKYVFYETYTNRCGKNRVNPNEMEIQVMTDS
ncbi:unnamed protein product [Adineta ricciae]|uniref:G-protein coupled receptors family 1 profile domain-containing protein n=1 Tax=Adineta ricciae TaxID=249248 RepID=A0A815TYA6_ADIRI|nr:unnamed protein product [Adineta ricciae]